MSIPVLASILALAVLGPLRGAGAPWDLTPLAAPPDWPALDAYQRTISRAEFEEELAGNYLASEDGARALIEVREDHAEIATHGRDPDRIYRLDFAPGESADADAPAFWRRSSALPPLPSPRLPLHGLRIVIDPGHLGGPWARMEQRWFLMPAPDSEPEAAAGAAAGADPPVNPHRPVMEGEIVLRVSEMLEAELTRLGARVALVRRRTHPVTDLRPRDFYEEVRSLHGLPGSATPESHPVLGTTSERLFYRSAEIRARGKRVNEGFRPDLVLCLHVNAEAWGDPANPAFVPKNHFHLLINGCYGRNEILKDDQRFELVLRLLQRIHPEELALAETIAATMAPRLGLPAFTYTGSNARQPGSNPYVWSRNLLATRIYRCPVIFFEPYVMNHEFVHARVQAGEYEGTRRILDREVPSLYHEYASAVAEGVAAYYRRQRTLAP